ncbi:hypothetical protein ACP70R_000586 [Stipagrostis hirtigluma subsp. patula]
MAPAPATMVDRREGTAAVRGGWTLPTDAFVEVLLRLPPRRRRRLRLVCRYWRDVISERSPVRRSQPTLALAFVVRYEGYTKASAAAYAIDDVAEGRCRELWRSKPVPPPRCVPEPWRPWTFIGEFDTALVGTCNGVLCLCDSTKPGGAVTLVNPAIGWAFAREVQDLVLTRRQVVREAVPVRPAPMPVPPVHRPRQRRDVQRLAGDRTDQSDGAVGLGVFAQAQQTIAYADHHRVGVTVARGGAVAPQLLAQCTSHPPGHR